MSLCQCTLLLQKGSRGNVVFGHGILTKYCNNNQQLCLVFKGYRRQDCFFEGLNEVGFFTVWNFASDKLFEHKEKGHKANCYGTGKILHEMYTICYRTYKPAVTITDIITNVALRHVIT